MMHGAKENIIQAIGNTPIIRISNIDKDITSEIYVKLEYMNPGGSTKDRIGVYMLDQANKKGELKPGGTIIEATSGNTGVGLALWSAIHGFKCIFVLADKQSKEKIDNLRAFGAKVVVCPTNVEPEDPRSYYSVADRLAKSIPNSYYVNQYNNHENRNTHYNWTAPEMFEQTNGDFDVFMAAVGTGGTISGCGRYFKEKMPNVKIVGVDCEGSIIAHFAKTGEMSEAKSYVLEGVGEDFIPDNYDFDNIDDFVTVGDRESFLMTRRLLKEEGVYAGGSAGAAIVGALRYAKTLSEPKKILVLLHDSGNRYSSKIFNDEWMAQNGYLNNTFSVQINEVLKLLNKPNEIITLKDSTTIKDAIDLMDSRNISQLPVLDSKDNILGIVQDKNLMKPFLSGEYEGSDPVSLGCSDSYKLVDINELLEKAAESLLKKEIVLIMEGKKLVNILTNLDLIQYLSLSNKN